MIKKMTSYALSALMVLGLSFNAVAAPIDPNSYEEAYKISAAIENNLQYDEATRSFDFETENAINQGLDQSIAVQLEQSVENLDEQDAAQLNEELKEAQPRGILATAAAFLVGAGFGWLADKLLDWGAEKFCNEYGDYNEFTATACEIVGY